MLSHDPSRPLRLGHHTFVLLRDLINDRFGLEFDDDKRDLLADKLTSRLAEGGFESFEAYYHHLRYDPGAADEWGPLIDALVVNETYFMREVDQLNACVDLVVPRLRAGRADGRLTIWSAACATGEEPYSLAMLLLERGRADQAAIVASDASRRALERARRGVYGPRSLRAMPPGLANRYLRPEGGGCAVVSSVRDLVAFRQLNLVDGTALGTIRGIDIIFCRNVFIYFDPASVRKVVDAFHDALVPGGYLFVGVSESLMRLTTRFELVEVGGAFAYRRL